jgi:CheY-like chemotaxis protein
MSKVNPVNANNPGPVRGNPEVPPETILLVDDRPANLLVYKTILEELGQTLMTANSGEEALKLVLKHDFAVILLDVNMPTMNGFDTAALIRKRRKSAATPIIFLTAFTDEANIAQGYASGAVDFMPTPVVPEVLKAKVRVFIELSQMRRLSALQAEEKMRRVAAEEAAWKAAFLSRVSESLARSQSQADLLSVLVRLPVPDLADVAVAWFTNDGGHDRIEWNQTLTNAETPPLCLKDVPWLDKLVAEVAATGQPKVLEDIPDVAPVGGIPFGNLGSAQALPLAVPGQTTYGVLVLACISSRQAGLISGLLVTDLAYRVGIALENVMLMERIREADRRKDEFLGMLAHELRNPLAPIINCLQLQKMIDPADPRMGSIRETMDRQARHMGRLIDDLLDATRLAHGKILLRKERCNLNTVVKQTVEDYRNVIDSSGLELDIVLPSQTIWVDGDPTRLVQAIGNLLHNAHKFSNPGGKVTVRLDTDADGVAARVVVADTGIGIERSMLSHVFDVFRQAEQGLDRSRGGLGLGLALVKGLTQLHGGEVQAFSAGLGEGAEFTIRLPVADFAGATPSLTAGSASGCEKHRILVIEDNRDAADSIRMLLQHDGHEVSIAYTAQQGLERAREYQPDVIFCDIGLPVIDGYQVIETIRQDAKLKDIFVVALTGYGREEDQKRAADAGFDLHLTKPIDYATLLKALQEATQGAPVGPVLAAM